MGQQIFYKFEKNPINISDTTLYKCSFFSVYRQLTVIPTKLAYREVPELLVESSSNIHDVAPLDVTELHTIRSTLVN